MLCEKGKTLTLLIWAPTLSDHHPKYTYWKIQSNIAYMLLYQFSSVQTTTVLALFFQYLAFSKLRGETDYLEKQCFDVMANAPEAIEHRETLNELEIGDFDFE